MSKEVKRYDCTSGGAPFCQGCYTMSECEFGEYVSWDDYEALLAERDALKRELAELVRVVAMSVDGSAARNKALAAADAALQGEQK